MSRPVKKILVVLAPIFAPWAARLMQELACDFDVRAFGIMGGPRGTFESVRRRNPMFMPLLYSHDLEREWVSQKPSVERLQFCLRMLGNEKLKRLIIADRHIGSGFI